MYDDRQRLYAATFFLRHYPTSQAKVGGTIAQAQGRVKNAMQQEKFSDWGARRLLEVVRCPALVIEVPARQARGGARGEGRTPMVSPPADFESAASAISPPGQAQ